MADKELGSLTSATTLDGTETHYVVQGGNSRKTTGAAIVGITHNQAWSTITGTPTTLSGYGITDAATSAQGVKADSALQPGDIGGTVQGYDALLSSVSSLAIVAGDLVYGSAADTVARLPIGLEGQVLKVGATGLPEWGAAAGGGDMLASVYDPTAKAADAFDMSNMVEGADAKIMTEAERINIAGAAQKSANLSDLADASAALNNLGINVDGTVQAAEAAADRAEAAAASTGLPAIIAGDTGKQLFVKQDGSGYELLSAGFVSVETFGAVGDGATDDTAAFQAAIDALPATGGQIKLTADDYAVNVALLDTGGRQILWTGGNKISGSVYRGLPGLNESFDAADKRQVYYEFDAEPSSFVRHDFRRNANYTGGTTGVSSVMRVYTEVAATAGAAGETVGEWPFQARVDNYSDNAQGVALTGQGRRYGKGATWAGHFNAIDYTDAEASAAAVWGYEANIQGDGLDSSMLRRVAGIIAHNVSQLYSGAPGTDVIGTGVYVYPDTADYKYGVVIETFDGAGVTKGEILDTALRIDAVAPTLVSAINPTSAALVKIGSRLSSGIIGQILGVGNNASASAVNYTDTRSEVDTSTAGGEKGRWRLYVVNGGAMTEYLRVNAGAGTPMSMNLGAGLKAVTEGAADSGGVGYRLLRVPN